MPTILSSNQRQFYQTEGYLHLRGVIPPKVLSLSQQMLARWVDQVIAGWLDQGLVNDLAADVDFQHRLARVWLTAGRPVYIRSPRRDLVSLEMYEILTNPTLLDLAGALLETEEISVHGIFNGRPKLPEQKWTDTPWHQDAQYYRDAEQIPVVSFWFPLQAVTIHNSCLEVAPRQHKGTLHEGHTDEETGFPGLSLEARKELRGVAIEMERGDALCFTEKTPHRALPNRSEAVRWSIDVRYEATDGATPSGRRKGFVARSPRDPSIVETFEQWSERWKDQAAGTY